jgi:hypothetical protein
MQSVLVAQYHCLWWIEVFFRLESLGRGLDSTSVPEGLRVAAVEPFLPQKQTYEQKSRQRRRQQFLLGTKQRPVVTELV